MYESNCNVLKLFKFLPMFEETRPAEALTGPFKMTRSGMTANIF